MEVTTLVIAIIGAVTGLGSLAWQVVTWGQGGPVVAVTARQSFPAFGAHLGDPHMSVTASNSGRSPVTVWITPGTLEALIPGRMQGHGSTEEVP